MRWRGHRGRTFGRTCRLPAICRGGAGGPPSAARAFGAAVRFADGLDGGTLEPAVYEGMPDAVKTLLATVVGGLWALVTISIVLSARLLAEDEGSSIWPGLVVYVAFTTLVGFSIWRLCRRPR